MFRGDENYRARLGWCVTYRATDKRADVLARYDQSPKGWMNGLRKRRTKALQRRKQRKEAEDSNG